MIKFILKMITFLICLIVLHYFNIISYLGFIPQENRYDIGIMAYFGLNEFMFSIVENYIKSKKVKIEFIFYQGEQEIDINKNREIMCKMNVCSTQLKIMCVGNKKILENYRIEVELPTWLNTQLDFTNTNTKYDGKSLIWEFCLFIGNGGKDEIILNIPFISTPNIEKYTTTLKPRLVRNKEYRHIYEKIIEDMLFGPIIKYNELTIHSKGGRIE